MTFWNQTAGVWAVHSGHAHTHTSRIVPAQLEQIGVLSRHAKD